MRRLPLLVFLILIVPISTPAAPRALADEGKLTFGARLGYAVAGGDAVKDSKMSDGLKGSIPLQLEVGYEVTKEINVGALLSYGFGRLGGGTKDTCDSLNLDCSARDVRVGLQATFAFEDLNPQFVPWIGFGVGYEWATLKLEPGSVGYRGFELANLQLGGDFKANRRVRFGPFLSMSFGKYSNGKLEGFGPGIDRSGSIDQTAVHNFITIGVRGQFAL